MNRKMYFPLLLRRALKKYPSILAITLITLAAIVLTAIMILRKDTDDADQKRVSVGVVGNTTDTFFDIGIDVIKNIDDSRYYIDIISLSKDDADKALEDGDIIGYVEIPENFIGSIASMQNVPAVYYLPNRPASLGTALTREVIDTVAVYITESQKVVAGLSSFISANGLRYEKSLDEISIRIMTDAILPRNELYETEHTGIAGSLSTGAYYVCGLLLFFMLLWGISCSGLFCANELSVSRILYSKGFGSVRQILCEYSVYLIVTMTTLLILAFLSGTVLFDIVTGIAEIDASTPCDLALYILGILPVVLSVCSMQLFIYEAVRGKVASMLAQFLTAIILGYLSGCFYPNYFFPEAVRRVIAFLPTGAAFEYMRGLALSEPRASSFIILMLYTAVFLILSAVIRRKRLAGDGE